MMRMLAYQRHDLRIVRCMKHPDTAWYILDLQIDAFPVQEQLAEQRVHRSDGLVPFIARTHLANVATEELGHSWIIAGADGEDAARHVADGALDPAGIGKQPPDDAHLCR